MKPLSSLAAILGLILGMLAGARLAHAGEAMPSMPSMSGSMEQHMALTELRPARPGDRERADAVVVAARAAMKRPAPSLRTIRPR